jgi:hypothetical protein
MAIPSPQVKKLDWKTRFYPKRWYYVVKSWFRVKAENLFGQKGFYRVENLLSRDILCRDNIYVGSLGFKLKI